MVLMILCDVCDLLVVDLIKHLLIELSGVQSGAPYKSIGFISESNNLTVALNDNFDLMIDLFSPKNARIALVFKLVCAGVDDPHLWRVIPK